MSFTDILRKTPHKLATLMEVSGDSFATVDYSYTNGSISSAESRILSAGDVDLSVGASGATSAPSMTIRLDNSDAALTWTRDAAYVAACRIRVSMVADDGTTTATKIIGTFRVNEQPRHGITEVELVVAFDWADLPDLDLPTLADLEAVAYSDCYYQNNDGSWSAFAYSGFYNTSPFALAYWSTDMTADKRAATRVPLWFGADWHETLKYCYQRSYGVSGELFTNALVPLFTTTYDPRLSTTFQDSLKLRFALSVPDAPGAAIASDCDSLSPDVTLTHPSSGFVSTVGVETCVAIVVKGAVTYYVVFARVGFEVVTKAVSNLSGVLRTGEQHFTVDRGYVWAAIPLGGFFGLISATPFVEGDYKLVQSTYKGPTQEPTTPTDERLTPLIGGLQQNGFDVAYVLSRLYWATTKVHGIWRTLSIYAKHDICSAADADNGHPVDVMDELSSYYGGFTVEPTLAAATKAATPFAAVTLEVQGIIGLRQMLQHLTYPFGIVATAIDSELMFSTSRMDPAGDYLFAAPVDAEEAHVTSVMLPPPGDLFAPFEKLSITGDSLSTPDMLALASEPYAAAKARLESTTLLTELGVDGVPGMGAKEVDVSIVDYAQRAAVAQQAAQLWPEGLERVEFNAAPWLIGVDLFNFLQMTIHRDGAWESVTVYLTGKRISFDGNSVSCSGYIVASALPVAYQMIDESTLYVTPSGDLVGGKFRFESNGAMQLQSGSTTPVLPVGSLVLLSPSTGTSITSAVANLGGSGYRNYGAFRVTTTWYDYGGLWTIDIEHIQDVIYPQSYTLSALEYDYGTNARFYLNAPASSPTGAVCNATNTYDFDGSAATQMKDG